MSTNKGYEASLLKKLTKFVNESSSKQKTK